MSEDVSKDMTPEQKEALDKAFARNMPNGMEKVITFI